MAYSLVQGDLGDPLLIQLATPAALAALPNALSVSLRWWKPDKSESVVSLVVIGDGTAGQVKHVWVSGETDMAGLHKALVEITDEDGNLVTDPNEGSHVLWNVYSRS